MITRRRAALLLLGCLVLSLACMAGPLPANTRPAADGTYDALTFERMVTRLRAGEPYYHVFGDELRHRNYPAESVFNWRTPLLLTGLARVPDAAGREMLVALGVLLFAATLVLAARESLWVAAGSIMQAGAIVPMIVPACLMMGETWAGLLIGLSACLYARQRTRWAVLLGLLALFVRELAAPYCVSCTINALVMRRRREVAAWLAGACLYGIYYGWHLLQVSAHRLPTDFAHSSPLLGLSGLATLLAKIHYHAWLLVLPPWCTALALTVVVAGIVAPKAPMHVRLASGVYVGFFLVAGRTFNGYWGLIAWPAWAIAFGYGIQEIWNAIVAVAAPPPSSQSSAACTERPSTRH